jgi:hypothetical protein
MTNSLQLFISSNGASKHCGLKILMTMNVHILKLVDISFPKTINLRQSTTMSFSEEKIPAL